MADRGPRVPDASTSAAAAASARARKRAALGTAIRVACAGVVAFAALLSAPCVCTAAVRIEGIDALTTAAGAELTVQMNGAVRYSTGIVATQDGRPDRIYLDLEGADVGAAPRLQALPAGPVRQVRAAQFTPTQARVVLDLAAPATYTVSTLDDPFRLLVHVAGDAGVADVGAGEMAAAGTSRRAFRLVADPTSAAAERAPSSGALARAGSPAAEDIRPAPLPPAVSPPPASPSLVSAADVERLREIAVARRTQSLSEDYVIGPDDLLEISVPDLTLPDGSAWRPPFHLVGAGPAPVAPAPGYANGVRVSASGDVTLPVLGSVPAAGYTPRGLERTLEDLLRREGILRRPEVHVFVVEYRSRVVSVIGAVARPGLYPLTGPEATISDMLWAAGGPTRDAGRIVDFAPAESPRPATASSARSDPRLSADLTSPISIDIQVLMQHRGDGANDPPARPGDVISLPLAGSVTVDGWVATPGAYPVTTGLSVTGAIAAAGGPQFPANLDVVEVVRNLGVGNPTRFQVNVKAVRAGRIDDVPVKDGDVVHVPMHVARVVPWAIWTAGRELIRIGGNVLLF